MGNDFLGQICVVPNVGNYHLGLCIFICSFVFSGFATIAAAIIDRCNTLQIIVGAIQVLLSPTLFGYVWAIIWGFRIWDKHRV